MRTWLRDIRKMKKLTEAQVALAAGVSQPFYHRVEMKGANLKVETAKAIARILGFDWNLFYPDN
jgi:transcriptional regulator with XRE-family HTH domain